MDLQDSLTISALGMGVVFAGLILTALLIFGLGELPRLMARLKAPVRTKASPASGPPQGQAIDPAVVGVIVAVLEVERRLHHAEHGGRLTIERPH
jgi:Na+-transporting methylmalonyl-CoA/oxaloacetate decarboxylase gamma subunit